MKTPRPPQGEAGASGESIMLALAPPFGEELWSVLVLAALALACVAGRRIGWLGRLIAGDGPTEPGERPGS